MTKDVFSSEPYQKKNSKAFLRACQNGNFEEVVGFVKSFDPVLPFVVNLLLGT